MPTNRNYRGPLFRLIHRIYEPEGAGLGYPVVEHMFYGRTPKEAERYFWAHMRTDSFLRACEQGGRFGAIRCVHETRMERVR